jgi:RHS repeat-associated protein
VTYDELGRFVGQGVNETTESFSYDAIGRIVTSDNALGHFERRYEKLSSRLETLLYPNGLRTIYSYYSNNHDRSLQTQQNLGPGGVNLSKFDFTYDAEGQVITLGKLLGTSLSQFWFDYDEAQQLVSAHNASNPVLAFHRYDYHYDSSGNRTSDSDYDPHPVGGGWLNGTFASYRVNARNQLVARTLQVNNQGAVDSKLIYDAVGNLIDDGEGNRFQWDAANRLMAVNQGNEKRSEFIYNGLSRCVAVIEKTGSAVIGTRRFVWNANRIVQEQDGNDNVVRRYFAEGEQRLHRERGEYYYTRDQLGNIREVTDGAGALQARYDYDPYGKRTKLAGSRDFDFGYTGYFHHERSGLDFALYRVYHPRLGRWLNPDPIAERGGLNLYEYAGNNPVNAIDPTGLFKVYGNWCGPDWTGRRRESYAPHASGYYQPPVNLLDAGCETHDVCYYQCRKNNPCDGEARRQCFRQCDRVLTAVANSYGGFWGRVVALAIDRPGKRNPEHDDPSCCRMGK